MYESGMVISLNKKVAFHVPVYDQYWKLDKGIYGIYLGGFWGNIASDISITGV